MAASLPDASFVGIDLSPRQVSEARALADALGLANVDLKAMSIGDVGDEFGTFDYIICHGVYSWVPREIQDAILRVCSRNLAPTGIAYVSYNTYPGWHVRAMVREMIVFHDDRTLTPRQRVARGRELVEFLAQQASGDDSVYRTLFERELVTLRGMSDSHFLHEELEAVNEPLWFAEFVRRAGATGLQVLAEAGLPARNVMLPADAFEQIQRWSTKPEQSEQYLDFLRGTTFRRTLLCRADVARTAEPNADAMPGLHLAGRAVPLAPPADPRSDTAEEFNSPGGHVLSTSHPGVRAALHTLFESRPRALAFPELWQAVRTRVGSVAGDGGEGARVLANAMVACAIAHAVQLHVRPAECAPVATARPAASRLAQLDAAAGRRITNLRHYSIDLPAFDRAVIAQLDGTRDRTELLAILRRSIDRGEIAFGDAATPSDDELPAALEGTLHRLATLGLLVA
jgi:methyltransferase-like protein/SAM-dependent methyltransferase